MDEKLTANEWKFINEIALKIHAVQDTAAMRTEFFQLLLSLIKFDYASFYLYRNGKSAEPVGYNITETELNSYITKMEDIDPFLPLRNLLSDPHYPAIKVSEYVFGTKLEDTDYYQMVWKPKKIKYSIFAGIGYKDQPLGSVSLYRKEESGEFTDRDVEIISILKGHLNIRLSDSMERCGIRSRSAECGLKEMYRLTDREIEIIELWVSGLTDDEISNRLSISKNTLKKHISNIFGKLEISTRVELLKIVNKTE